MGCVAPGEKEHLIFYTETKNVTVKQLLAEKASRPFNAVL